MKIKIGDIFYENHGIATFYQVVKVYDSGRVRIREIESELGKKISSYEFEAMPIINKFKAKEELSKTDAYSRDIKDNDKGTIKVVNYFDDGTPFLDLKGTYSYASLWDGKPVVSSYWYVWMK